MAAIDVFFVRHGETQANADGIVQGWLDTDLNEQGQSQARRAAEAFEEAVDIIFSSDLKRASQTAAHFRSRLPDVPYKEDRRLRERNFGDASGQHKDGLDWEVFWASSDTVSIPNAEILNDFDARVRDFLDELRSSDYEKVLVVTHGGTINRVQSILGGENVHNPHGNASVTHISLV